MQVNLDELEVVNNTAERRFEMQVGEYLALIDYIERETLIIYTHTEVPNEIGGQGIAGKMARTALDYARDNDLKVIPRCPYVSAYIRKHPEYQPLVWIPTAQPSQE